MRQTNRKAFTLVELLVVIAIIGTLVALLLPAVQAARESARSNTCRSNMTNLQKAISQREQSQGSFPGYVNYVGPSGDQPQQINQKLRASWIVTTFPYIEQPALWDAWSRGNTSTVADLYSPLEILVCPSDPPDTQDQPVMNYVANAGAYFEEGTDQALTENAANGVFFDRTRSTSQTSAVHPQDIRDLPTGQDPDPEVVMTSAYIGSKGDGLTNTIMLSESVTTYLWGYHDDADSIPDKKYYFGFTWDNPANLEATPGTTADAYKTDPTFRKINGQRVDNAVLMSSFNDVLPNYGFPSSNHPGGVNVAFCGGAVNFVSEEITPTVYAQLMTTNRKGSLLPNGTAWERKLKQPSDGDY